MKKLLYSLAFIAGIANVQSQTVTTFVNDPTKRIDDGMVLDYQGNLFGSHFNGTNVYKVTPAGIITIFATGFNTPNGLAFDSQNNLYVCDLYGNRIYKISYSGVFIDTILIPNPSGIVKSLSSDTMIFTQYQSNTINKLAPNGTVIPLYSGAPLNGPIGIVYDSTGVLYVANFNNRKIHSVGVSALNYVATVPGPASGWLGLSHMPKALYGEQVTMTIKFTKSTLIISTAYLFMPDPL